MMQDDPCRSLYLGEFSPGMWIGNLQSVKYVLDQEAANVGTVGIEDISETIAGMTRRSTWTIISILESDRLLDFVRDLTQKQPEIVQKHYLWKLPDSSQADFLSDKLVQVVAYMDESFQKNSNSKCLVHCAMGISRSAAVCAAWLMHQNRHYSLPEAMSVLRRVRPGVRPNMGLTAALLSIQATHGDIRAAVERCSSLTFRDESVA